MYADYATKLSRLIGRPEDGMLSEKAVAILAEIFGPWCQPLRNGGRVELTYEDGGLPAGALAPGVHDSILEISNAPIAPATNYSPWLGIGDANHAPNGWGLNLANGAARFAGPVAGVMKWAKANANWTNASGDGSYVTAYVATDYAGTLASPSESITIYLPRYGTGLDPAVYNNGVIPYFTDLNGRHTCPLTPTTRVGDFAFCNTSSNIPTGWQQADGTNGTWDMRDYHMGGYKSGGTYSALDGTTVYGQASVTPTISGSGTAALTISSATTGITAANTTVAAHADHYHKVTPDGNDPGPIVGGTEDATYPAAGYWISSAQTDSGGTASSLTHTAHTHTINDSGHTHSGSTVSISTIAGGLTSSAVSTVPPTKAVFIIQRVT